MHESEKDEPIAPPADPRRPVISPDLDDRRPSWRRAPRARAFVVAGGAVLVGAVLVARPVPPASVAPSVPAATAAAGGAAAGDPVVAPVAAAAAAAPGEDSGVQRWLKARERLQIELVNAASAVAKLDPARARAGDGSCARLAAVTTALNVFAAAPDARMDQLSRTGLVKFTEGARACLAGDIPGAIAAAKAGLAERADAMNALDDLLEGK
jgi:hypothetical protein